MGIIRTWLQGARWGLLFTCAMALPLLLTARAGAEGSLDKDFAAEERIRQLEAENRNLRRELAGLRARLKPGPNAVAMVTGPHLIDDFGSNPTFTPGPLDADDLAQSGDAQPLDPGSRQTSSGVLLAQVEGPTRETPMPKAGPTKPDGTSPLVNFHGFNILYLYGFNWDLGEDERDIVTFEYFNNTSWGDTYFFADVSNILTEDPTVPVAFYSEFSPRFSLKKLFGWDLSGPLVKDVLTAHTIELGSNAVSDPLRHLHGIGLALDLPGFKFANLNFYLRDDTDLSGVTWQITAAGLVPFDIGGLKLSYGGFVDFAGEEETSEFNIVSGTRLMADLGDVLYGRSGEFYAGIEFAYWYNEFGIDGQDEFVPQLAFQFSF